MTITHTACGNPVSFDPMDISPGDPDLLKTGESSTYYAACLECDEDVFEFETEKEIA